LENINVSEQQKKLLMAGTFC